MLFEQIARKSERFAPAGADRTKTARREAWAGVRSIGNN